MTQLSTAADIPRFSALRLSPEWQFGGDSAALKLLANRPSSGIYGDTER
jgi:hypothetical protein